MTQTFPCCIIQCVSLCSARVPVLAKVSSQMLHFWEPVLRWILLCFSRSALHLNVWLQKVHAKFSRSLNADDSFSEKVVCDSGTWTGSSMVDFKASVNADVVGIALPRSWSKACFKNSLAPLSFLVSGVNVWTGTGGLYCDKRVLNLTPWSWILCVWNKNRSWEKVTCITSTKACLIPELKHASHVK